MTSIPCICINDKDRPSEIPVEKWIKEGEKYHVTHIFKMMQQPMIQGCELKERDISDCIPFNCFRIDRFAFEKEHLPAIMEMIQRCSDLNSIELEDLQKYIEQIPTQQES